MSSKTLSGNPAELLAVLDRLKARFRRDAEIARRVGVSRSALTLWRQGKPIADMNWQRLLALDQGEVDGPGGHEVMRRYVEARNRLEAIFLSGAEDNRRFVERVLRLLAADEGETTATTRKGQT